MSNVRPQQSSSQLALSFHQGPGRPTIQPHRRRKTRSVTLAPELITRFDTWTYRNCQSFSRGVEAAILAFMDRSDNNADV